MGKVKKSSSLPKPLTPRQIGILEDLEGLLERLKEYEGRTPEEMQQLSPEARFKFILFQNDYWDVVLKAIRARLDKHPLVEEKVKNLLIGWVRNRQALGQWDLLRRARPRGIEVGVRRPMSEKKARLLVAYEKLREGDEEAKVNAGKVSIRDNTLIPLQDIIQIVLKNQRFDPDKPIPKRKMFKKEVHRRLMNSGINRTVRQVLFEKIKRLDPRVD